MKTCGAVFLLVVSFLPQLSAATAAPDRSEYDRGFVDRRSVERRKPTNLAEFKKAHPGVACMTIEGDNNGNFVYSAQGNVYYLGENATWNEIDVSGLAKGQVAAILKAINGLSRSTDSFRSVITDCIDRALSHHPRIQHAIEAVDKIKEVLADEIKPRVVSADEKIHALVSDEFKEKVLSMKKVLTDEIKPQVAGTNEKIIQINEKTAASILRIQNSINALTLLVSLMAGKRRLDELRARHRALFPTMTKQKEEFAKEISELQKDLNHWSEHVNPDGISAVDFVKRVTSDIF